MHPGAPWAEAWAHPATLQHRGQEGAHVFMQRGTRLPPGLREGSGGAEGPSTCTQAAAHTAGEKGDVYLLSPSSPGTSKPWPPVLGLRQRAVRLGQGSGGFAGTVTSPSAGGVASGPGARSTARPQARASGASPGPGCCLKGCLPGQGGCAGAGHSLHSDGGCSWDSGLPGRKQAGPVLGRRRQSPARPEGRTRSVAAALRRLKSVHVLRCALFG